MVNLHIAALLFFLSTAVNAQNLGTFGETFSIAEEDLLVVIQNKLQNISADNLLLHQGALQEKMVSQVKNPAAVAGIITTKNPRVFSFDPSITLPYDLKDHQGKVFAKAGTIVNPLDTHSLTMAIVFIDGDDKKQVAWAINEHDSKAKIILVKGSPFELMDEHDRTIYFDQNGTLVKKFGIRQVPARITQAGKLLQVEELLLKASH